MLAPTGRNGYTVCLSGFPFMTKEILLLCVVLAPVIVCTVGLVRQARNRPKPSLKFDFRKAKEHERKKNSDLSAWP